jgi:hypothetical protein
MLKEGVHCIRLLVSYMQFHVVMRTMPGLGFYYIPNNASVKAKLDVKAAVIRISEGILNIRGHSRDGASNSWQMELGCTC